MVQKLFKHNGEECPEFQSDEEAIDQLEQLLNEIGQKQPILLILDDVWPGSESLIEKFKFDIPDYKIVVTSRTAFPRFPYRYNLNPLNRVDAKSLFCYSASLQDRDESSYIPEEYIEKVLCQSNIYIYIYSCVDGCMIAYIPAKIMFSYLHIHLSLFVLFPTKKLYPALE